MAISRALSTDTLEAGIFRVRLPAADMAEADRLSDALRYALRPETEAAGMIETEAGWLAEAFYTEEPDLTDLRAIVVRTLGEGGADRRIDCIALADRNWVRESLEAMPPVDAGRFVVYGHHDRDRVPGNAIGIEIDAGLAFGTGHHGTTRGCLMALDRLLKQRRFRRPLDIGCGTGVLAVAAAKALKCPVLATDIDPVAVRITRENAAKNGAHGLVRAVVADGVGEVSIAAGGPYDLVLANILAGPLIRLAPSVRPLVAPGGVVILSGLLTHQRRAVEAAWRVRGFVPLFRIVLDGWMALALRRA